MEQWEYAVLTVDETVDTDKATFVVAGGISDRQFASAEAALATIGLEGWEITGTITTETHHHYDDEGQLSHSTVAKYIMVFKRRVKQRSHGSEEL